jgi:AcrR family transcriptional regulator
MEAGKTRGRGRPRCEATEGRILCTTMQLLEEEGYGGVTIEAIAKRAGVSKATMYRRWPNRASVILSAFLCRVIKNIDLDDDQDPEASLRLQMDNIVKVLCNSGGTVLSALLAEAQACPQFAAEFRDHFVGLFREKAYVFVRRGIERGHFKSDLDVEVVVDVLFGPLFHALLLGHRQICNGYAARIADTVFGGIRVNVESVEPAAAS